MALVACEACGRVSYHVCASACCRRRLCDGFANGVRATTFGQCPACERSDSVNEWGAACQAEGGVVAGARGSGVYGYGHGGGSNSGGFSDGFSGGGCRRLRVEQVDSQTRALLQMRTECTRCGALLPLAVMHIHMATLCSRRRHRPYELDSEGKLLGLVESLKSSNVLELENDVSKSAENVSIVDGKLNCKRRSMEHLNISEVDNQDVDEKMEESHEEDAHEPPTSRQKIMVDVEDSGSQQTKNEYGSSM